jgi:hypothetical protein
MLEITALSAAVLTMLMTGLLLTPTEN